MNRRCWLYEDLHMPEMRASGDGVHREDGAGLHQVQEADGARQGEEQDGVGGVSHGKATD